MRVGGRDSLGGGRVFRGGEVITADRYFSGGLFRRIKLFGRDEEGSGYTRRPHYPPGTRSSDKPDEGADELNNNTGRVFLFFVKMVVN